MNTPDDLDSKSDAELSEIFAVEVADMRPLFVLLKRGYYYRENAHGYTDNLDEAWKVTEDIADKHVYPHDERVDKRRAPYPSFAASVDTVLPWLVKWHDYNPDLRDLRIYRTSSEQWTVVLRVRETVLDDWDERWLSIGNLPRCICTVLIRSKRAAK